MKTNISLYLTIINAVLFNCLAQNKQLPLADKKIKNVQITTRDLTKKNLSSIKIIKLYHVEERINMQFGGYTTTYTVSDPSLIRTNDLGPNNTRVVTPRFVKENKINDYVKKNIDTISSGFVEVDTMQYPLQPPNLTVADSLNHQNGIAYITMIKTFERIAEKGYKSVEMFQKLGNAYYYNSQLDKAAKWYKKLFEMTTNLEPEYYYRYAHSLKAIGERDKANETLEKYNQLTENTK